MTPYEVLGVPPQASASTITAAYRVLVQIFHPDRFHDAPEPVRREAERRMQAVNLAYAQLRGKRGERVAARPSRPARSASFRPGAGTPWDVSVQARVAQTLRAEQARLAREQEALNGQAVPRPKLRPAPSHLNGLGEALVRNKMRCRTCDSIQWLPDGWRGRLSDEAFFCSNCDTLLLSR